MVLGKALTTKSEWCPDDPTAFAPTKPWKLPFITTWGGSPNRNLPTNSAEEASKQGGLMSQKRIHQIEQRIDRVKRALLEIGPMRPGSLTRQYKDPQHHTGAYWQISYTRQMKSRTEYVRKEYVKDVRRQTVTHKRFKRLVDQWIELSIEHSRLTMQIAEPRASR